jgi:sporulation protein YlmC with PRC-barrel domain
VSIKYSLLGFFIITCLVSQPVLAQTAKASDWVGRVVVTTDGELLGRVEDFSLDVEQKRVDYVVVSIGSFLVDDNLIAVHPDALGESEDSRYLVVYTDSLGSARRFGADNWPASADVLASAERQPVSVDEVEAQDNASGFSGERVATISDGQRTATMKSGENEVQFESNTAALAPGAEFEVQPKRFTGSFSTDPVLADSEFERLDDNSDGYLSRSEIGPRLQKSVRYQDYDLDGNEGIDAFEFQILKDRS